MPRNTERVCSVRTYLYISNDEMPPVLSDKGRSRRLVFPGPGCDEHGWPEAQPEASSSGGNPLALECALHWGHSHSGRKTESGCRAVLPVSVPKIYGRYRRPAGHLHRRHPNHRHLPVSLHPFQRAFGPLTVRLAQNAIGIPQSQCLVSLLHLLFCPPPLRIAS